ncbi:MAG: tetratricopeptide repeat protein [Commensalibacter sp.]
MENVDPKKELELGFICYRLGYWIGARDHWLNIPKSDDDIYGEAQFWLGVSYNKEGDIKTARDHWSNILQCQCSLYDYNQAQFCLGSSYYNEGDIEIARDHWKSVPEKIDIFYSQAEFHLGISYYPEDDSNHFLEYWSNVLNIQCSFQKGRYNSSLVINNIQKVIDYFRNKKSNKKNILRIYEYIQSIQKHTNNILKKLYIDKKEVCEQNVAHYTRADVARIIIRNGYFQLGVSNHMNDLLEGKILRDLFNISICYNNDLLAFLTSFTFNENSLNQFRLYGKEDNKDGTGVSLVINNNFFKSWFGPIDPSDFINMSFKAANINDLQTNQSKVTKENITEKKEDINKHIRLSEKLPLFRCIYIDPKTNYVSVASKSKASFYDLMKNEENIEGLWENYSKKINDLSKSLEDELRGIKGNIEEIKNFINEIGSENSEAIYEAIGTTLLPLIYLTKHVAFEEEAECRIFYITSLTNNLIKSPEKERRLYVEYSTKITALDSDNKIYLEKIYLGPKADSKMELILKKDWIDSQDLKSDQHADIPKIEKSTLPLA